MSQCIVCRCTDERACPEGCSWTLYAPPVCSSCVEIFAIARLMAIAQAFDVGARRTASKDLKQLRAIWSALVSDSGINASNGATHIQDLRRINIINRRIQRFELEGAKKR